MESIVFMLAKLSLSSGILILVVMLARLLLKRAPASMRMFLWLLVGVRLLLPFSIESRFSLNPVSKFTYNQNQQVVDTDSEQEYFEKSHLNLNQEKNTYVDTTIEIEKNYTVHTVTTLLFYTWITGIAMLFSLSMISYIKLKHKLVSAIPEDDLIYRSDKIDTAFVFGMLHPRIYVPDQLENTNDRYVILHEKTHIQYRDYLIKPIGFLFVIIYWFHPLVWLAYILFSKDIELACDERVLHQIGLMKKKEYSNALLDCSIRETRTLVSPVAFGRNDIRKRIKHILTYKNPSFRIKLSGILIFILISISFLTEQKNANTAVTIAADREVDTSEIDQTSNDSKEIESNSDSTQETEENTDTVAVTPEDPIIWYEDLTQDGIDDKIVVDLTYVLNYPETGEEQTVCIYSGSTQELIWSGHADIVHPGWNGIYVYKEDNQSYLMIWQPTMYQGIAEYSYRIFALTESGEEQVINSSELDFDINQPDDCDTDKISSYIDDVNQFLSQSYVLVDTDNGEPVYSTSDHITTKLYDDTDILESIESLRDNQ